MGTAAADESAPFHLTAHKAAVALCRTEQGNLHSGVLYRFGDRVLVLHLGTHDRILEDWKWPKIWAVPDVDPEVLFLVAAVCRRIKQRFEKEPRLPYGIAFRGSSFDKAGRLVLGEGAVGVTCSTLVLAVFLYAGVSLIAEATWPVRKDNDKQLLGLLKSTVPPEHFKLLEHEVSEGVRRIWPDEVVGACACPLPAEFSAARAAANSLLNMVPK